MSTDNTEEKTEQNAPASAELDAVEDELDLRHPRAGVELERERPRDQPQPEGGEGNHMPRLAVARGLLRASSRSDRRPG